MKRLLSTLLTFAMLLGTLSLVPFTVSAEYSGTWGDLTWTLDDEGTLTISGEGEMNGFTSSSTDAWLGYKSNVKTVVINDGVTSISNFAFVGCTSLKSITIPDSVTSIGDWAFYNTTYYNDENNWENGVLYIGNHLIKAKEDISGDYTIKNGTKCIAGSAFYHCTYLTSVTIGDSVTSIGNDAFSDCYSLNSITIPDSVTSIGEYAFSWCNSLTSIEVDTANTAYCDIDGVLFNKDKTTLVQYPAGKTTPSYTIPDSVTSVVDYAFSGCTSLTSVTIPDGVTSIGERAFYYCTSLTSVTMPDSVTFIGGDAFYYCTSLTSVTIPDGVTSIGNYAFYYCKSLTSVTIPDSVTSIGEYAFDSCTSLKSVTIPNSVTFIGGGAFSRTAYYNDENNWENGVLYIGNHLIEANQDISGDYTIKNGTKCLADDAFYECTSLTSVTIPNSVTFIGGDAFYYCTSLTSVTIGNGVTYISNDVFAYCDSLTSITIPDGVTSIGWRAFRGCTSLTSITIPDSVTYIGDYAFDECTSLTSITIPNSVTSIGWGAFYGCTSLTSITIGGSVSSIGNSAFYSCTAIETVNYCGSEEQWNKIKIGYYNDPLLNANIIYNYVPESEFAGASGIYGNLSWNINTEGTLTISGAGAMEAFGNTAQPLSLMPKAVKGGSWHEYSRYIVRVVIKDGVTSISDGAFANCENLVSVSIPKSVIAIASTAFVGSGNLETIDYAGSEEEWNDIGASGLPESVEVNYSTSDGLVGDVNGDEYVDNTDALMTLKYDAGIIDLGDAQLTAADVNGDGYADNTDALMILKYDAGIIDEL